MNLLYHLAARSPFEPLYQLASGLPFELLYHLAAGLPFALLMIWMPAALFVAFDTPTKKRVGMERASAYIGPFCIAGVCALMPIAVVSSGLDLLLDSDGVILAKAVMHGVSAVVLVLCAKPFVRWRAAGGKPSAFYWEQYPLAGVHALWAFAALCVVDAVLAAAVFVFA